MRRALAAAVLVALAGCSAAVVGTDTPTVTPVPVPAEGTPVGATATPDEGIAPGLTLDGVADAFAFAGAHREALSGKSYTATSVRSVRTGNGTLREVRRTVNVASDRTTYRMVQVARSDSSYPVSSAFGRVAVWVDDAGALYRVGRDDPRYRYHTSGPAATPVTDLTHDDRLVGVYSGLDWRVTARDVDSVGTAYYVLRADRATAASVLDVPQLVTEPRNVRARAVVTGAGRLRQYRIAYDATLGERRVRVVRSLRFRRVGVTTVERPDWYAAAVNATARPAPSGESTATEST